MITLQYPPNADEFIGKITKSHFVRNLRNPLGMIINLLVSHCLDGAIRNENEIHSTRKIKTLEKLTSLLQEAGYTVSTDLSLERETVIVAHMKHLDFFIRRKLGSGISVSAGKGSIFKSVRWQNSHFTRSSISEEDLVTILKTFDDFMPELMEKVQEKQEEAERLVAVGMLSRPSIEVIVAERLRKLGIAYEIQQGWLGNIILKVQIVNNIWMKHTDVTIDNVDRLLGLVPYLIKRPDCIQRDGMGFEMC